MRGHFFGSADADDLSVWIGDDDVRFAGNAIERYSGAATMLPLVSLKCGCNLDRHGAKILRGVCPATGASSLTMDSCAA